jgi:hypothetical protein
VGSVQAVEVVRGRLADAKEAAVAGHSTDKPDRSDHAPNGRTGSSPPRPQRQRQPRKQRQPRPKNQLEFWALVFANTGNTIRAIAFCIGGSLAIAVPFAGLALVFTLLHLQFAVPAAMYAGATAMVGGFGVAIRMVWKRRSNNDSDNGGGDDAAPGGDPSDDSG